MTLIEQAPALAPAPSRSAVTDQRNWLRRTTWVVALFAVVGWLPFINAPTSSDEGGYLLVASQWHPGTSLYGDYWVDRPPLLFVIHAIAAHLGGTEALRLIGIAAVVGSIFLATALVGEVTARHRSSAVVVAAPAIVAGVFMTTPLFGATQVNGELLSIPLLLGGILALVRASTANRTPIAVRWAAAAGVMAMCAAMVKQSSVDVLVFAAVSFAVQVVGGERRRSTKLFAAFAGGAISMFVVILAAAAELGTRVSHLWNALVTFRFQAATTIHTVADSASSHRLNVMVLAALVSVVPAVVCVLAWHVRRPLARTRVAGGGAPDLRWPALAVIAWEIIVIVGGGGYWLHYLLVLVPGVVVLAAAATQRASSGGKALTAVLVAAVVSATAVTSVAAIVGPNRSGVVRVSDYLRAHARPQDTAVVAFGHPNILWDARLSSPYQELWSLPVRVRDPRLADLTRVLESDKAPNWVVSYGNGLPTWGVDATEADRVLMARYHRAADLGSYVVWRRDKVRDREAWRLGH